MPLPKTIAATLTTAKNQPAVILHDALPDDAQMTADELVQLAITLRMIASDARQRHFNRETASARRSYPTTNTKHQERY